MKVPNSLAPLLDDGIIDGVERQLQSGKEATVYIVRCGDTLRCAKVYKDAEQRGFHKLAEYQEGRKARGSRDARAAGRRSRHGRKVLENQWKSAEADALYKLVYRGVRVPEPMGIFEGVLIMDLVTDADGQPAPRLSAVDMTPAQARDWHAFMIGQIVRMLCVGIIHGDLSEFNVLVGPDGPVIIDLPQAVDAASNNNAFAMFQRDVNNMRTTFGRVVPELLDTHYAHEIWDLYQAGVLTPDMRLSGEYVHDDSDPDVDGVLDEIEDARLEAEARERGREMAERDDDAWMP